MYEWIQVNFDNIHDCFFKENSQNSQLMIRAKLPLIDISIKTAAEPKINQTQLTNLELKDKHQKHRNKCHGLRYSISQEVESYATTTAARKQIFAKQRN